MDAGEQTVVREPEVGDEHEAEGEAEQLPGVLVQPLRTC